VGVRDKCNTGEPNVMPRVAFLVVASMVLATTVLAIADTFTSNNKWLLITTGALAIVTALTTITTTLLITKQ